MFEGNGSVGCILVIEAGIIVNSAGVYGGDGSFFDQETQDRSGEYLRSRFQGTESVGIWTLPDDVTVSHHHHLIGSCSTRVGGEVGKGLAESG